MNSKKNEIKSLLNQYKRILITGGAGFIGSALVRRLLEESNALIFNLDKIGYASDLTSIDIRLKELSEIKNIQYQLLKLDLTEREKVDDVFNEIDPDLIFHLAAESHVDRSIDKPETFINSNILGTYNLLEASLKHFDKLDNSRQRKFRFLHISTDEVFGSLGTEGRFTEKTRYDPRSPYSASKAASDHLVSSWYHTYGLPTLITNCSNNFGPWQFPEKLIPLVILKALSNERIPVYGDGSNKRDWLYVEDHVDALLLAAIKGEPGKSYCIGGFGEKSNLEVVNDICKLLNELKPSNHRYEYLIDFVKDRPGHDFRYSIDPTFAISKLGWEPTHDFKTGLRNTVQWYLQNLNWAKKIQKKSGYTGERVGTK